jgi:hypothetical protein
MPHAPRFSAAPPPDALSLAARSVQDGVQQARLARLLSKCLLRLGEAEPSTLMEAFSEAEAFCVRVRALPCDRGAHLGSQSMPPLIRDVDFADTLLFR